MKKRLLSLCLALTLTLTPFAAAFSDISDAKLAQSASMLSALGIMQGVGGDRFAPNSTLTRAQFCKLAVVSLGVTQVGAYSNYTIFPDVRNTHWAAPYINAAVRDSKVRNLSIIRGYADGTFGPDKTVTFGETCTMLLRMLGYTDSDIGPFWPQDYVSRASALKLTENVSVTDPSAVVKRSDAAYMLLNTLAAEKKDGGTLLSGIASSTVEDCILLATSETNSSLAADEAIFYEGGEVDTTPRRTSGTLDKSMIGVRGTLMVGKEPDRVVLGVVSDGRKTETMQVVSTSASTIQTSTGNFTPSRSTKLYLDNIGTLGTYAEQWSHISSGTTLTLYYNDYGSLDLIAALPSVSSSTAAASTFVYGLPTSAKIPNDYTVVKNGVTIDASKLQRYDVITLDASKKQAVASDRKLSGRYEAGAPTFHYPQRVTLFGDTYSISDRAAETFANINLGDYITLLFDANGNVAAAYPKSTVSADMQGIITAIDGTGVTLSMLSGLTVHTTIENDATQLFGKLVTLGQSNDKAYVTVKALSGKESGTWTTADGKLGSKQVSPNVRVYEEVLSGAPLNRIAVSDIPESTVPAGQIKFTIADNAGTITDIVLGDVTGESWIYGVGFGASEGTQYSIDLRHWNGTSSELLRYNVTSLPTTGLNGNPVGVPKGYSSNTALAYISLSTQPLTLVDTVSLSAFNGISGVQTKSGNYDIADDVGVYHSVRKEMISLSEAKNNYTSFRLYANKTAAEGGKIRVIVVS